MQLNKEEGLFARLRDMISLGHMAGCSDEEKGVGYLGNDNWK